jgi:outer membrane protein
MKHFLLITVFTLAGTIIRAQDVRILTLPECIDIAIENNLNVKRGRLNLENSKIDYNQSRAQQLPNANLQGSLGRNWGRSIDPTTNQFISQQITSSGFGGSTGVTLFNAFSLTNAVKQARVSVEASEFDLEKTKNDVSLDIATFYLNVIFNKELVENAEYQLQSTQEQLQRTSRLVELGSLPLTNELELVSQVASAEVNLINQQNALDLALLSLKQAMLIPANEQIDIVVPDIDMATITEIDLDAGGIYGISEEIQPEIKSADLNVEAANLGLKVAHGNKYPSLSLGGSFRTNYSDAFDMRPITVGDPVLQETGAITASGESVLAFAPQTELVDFGFGDQYDENLSYSLGLQLNIPIFNNLQTHSNVQRNKIFLQQAEINSVEQRNILRQQIETAYTNTLAARKAYEASEKQVQALEETFRAIENQYNLGASNFTDYQVAINNLFRAQSDLVRTKYDYIFKRKILDFYQGIPITFEQ